MRALARRDITEPFPVQQMVVRDALAGHDLLVQSPTGSGKTLAFGIPLVELLEPGAGDTSALVLAPTRELAGQIVDELRSIADARGLQDRRRLRRRRLRPADQGGATRRHPRRHPGPARGPDRPRRRLARAGPHPRPRRGRPDARHGLQAGRRAGSSPRPRSDRQTLFFSATLEGATGKIAAAYTRDARRHTQAADKRDKADIEHRFLHVDSQSAKLDHLVAQLRDDEGGSTLVFVRTKRGADRLAKRLRSHEVEAVAMHGDKSQRQRERALARFEAGEVDALIATDVAARGIDVAGVTHVINFDAPGDRDSYVHRVGRTGRAGRTRHRDQLRPRRPGRRGAPDGRRPRPRPRVRRRRGHARAAAPSRAHGNAKPLQAVARREAAEARRAR